MVASTCEDVAERFPDSPILTERDVGRVIAAPLRRGTASSAPACSPLPTRAHPTPTTSSSSGSSPRRRARRCGAASFHESEASARRQAELRRVISEALNRAVVTADVGQAIRIEGRYAFDAESLALFVVDSDEPSTLLLAAQDGLDDQVTSRSSRIGLGTPEARGFPDASPLFLEGAHEVRAALELPFDTTRWGSAAVLPLTFSGQTIGWIVAGFGPTLRLTSATRVALSGLAAEASVAVGRARGYELEHDVAVTLQRSLLPKRLPAIDGWAISAWYAPGSEHLIIGGDLFDVTTFDDGRMLLVVGDVVGHGLRAAAANG